jgi:acylpyruvate hydrolase
VFTLEPGDVVATGTPGGAGFAMDPPQFLEPGDVVRVEIEQIGAIENAVVQEREHDRLLAVAQEAG